MIHFKRNCAPLFIVSLLLLTLNGYSQANPPENIRWAKVPVVLQAEEAAINRESAMIVEDDRLTSKRGVMLMRNIHRDTTLSDKADLVFKVQVPAAGLYRLKTHAVTNEEGAALMKVANSKYESLFLWLRIGSERPTKRVVYVPWDVAIQETGIFELGAGQQEIKVWLPVGVKLDYLEILPYEAPRVPVAAQEYKPRYLPSQGHPRLWVNSETLAVVRKNLKDQEHIRVWEKIAAEAQKPYTLFIDPQRELAQNEELERAAEKKAFYFLMTGDKQIGREAVTLILNYIQHVEFGNILDVTRELGRAIYTASLVYDWAYELITAEEKQQFRKHLMRLARDMEIGWPPFKMGIVNGHGNEAMVNRDFLAMSIALYDEDPVPYKYVSYAILEQLVPMRKFEYQSPRHNQGVAYGAYRFGLEMHAVQLYYRMLNQKVFDDNIMDLGKFFLYMRAPDGQMLRDGDGFNSGKPGEDYYWKNPLTMFMIYSYSGDPIMKGEYLRQGGIEESHPVLYLLLNDPSIKAQPQLQTLPLTLDFGPVLGGMVARTGWNIGPESDDVVAEIKGGGYHFGNHQHSDAGSIQLFYRGFQLGDLGVYRFYGTPYDMGFNKRSVAHSMMLAYEEGEKFGRSDVNDGGARLNQRNPASPGEAMEDPWFHNGKVISSSFGPDKIKPFYSYFSVDLKSAYSEKISHYVRSFCFLNLNKPDIPAVIVMKDEITTRNPDVQKYLQINSHNPPQPLNNAVLLENRLRGRTGRTHIRFFHQDSLRIDILSGSQVTNVFGKQLEVPETEFAEAKGHRVMVSSKKEQRKNKFITVFQVLDESAKPMQAALVETPHADVIYLENNVTVLIANSDSLQKIRFKLNGSDKAPLVVTELRAGKWTLFKAGKKVEDLTITKGENAGLLSLSGGTYVLSYANE